VSEQPTWVDLDHEGLAEHLPDRPLRSYPALLSTEADAMAWAREGAVEGALVVADYQASPRGRGGLPWQVHPGEGLGFSLVLRPGLEPAREGWLYTVATAALATVVEAADGPRAVVRWPDEVLVDERRAAAVGVHAEPDEVGIDWAVITVLIEEAHRPRGPLLARSVRAIEARLERADDEVLAEHEERCATIGRSVRVHLVPLGPAGTVIEGDAVGCRPDGALAIETGPGRRIAVPPGDLGRLEAP
jgi:BirA family transcriptional regulator, biotin operon repressor / biotin---[acetyl-CoA-carboxylase] ligase